VRLNDLKDVPPWDWPEDARSVALTTLLDRTASIDDRVFAADVAGDYTVVNDAAAEALLSVIETRDEPDEVRSASAIALGPAIEQSDITDFDGNDEYEEILISKEMFKRVMRVLRAVHDDPAQPRDVRRRALEASVRAPRKWHTEAILAAYGSTDRLWRLTAVFGMVYVSGFNPQIVEALASDDREIHYQATRAAGAQQIGSAWDHVLKLALSEQTETHLRAAAIDSAFRIRPAEAARKLGGLTRHRKAEIAKAADDALMMSGPEADADVVDGDPTTFGEEPDGSDESDEPNGEDVPPEPRIPPGPKHLLN
jgi:uncharacterized protein (UPF0147 family)